jgi:hypothetical protein
MKKIGFFILLLICAFPILSALEIDMSSNISQGETVIASVSGNFFDPITKDNIYFYRGHVRTSFDYDVAKIGDTYYIYFLTTNKAENNYSINISGVRYAVGSQVSSQQISKSFKIINKTADFSVNPGFIITDGNFSIQIQNLQAGSITVELATEVNSGSSRGFFGFLFGTEEVSQSVTLSSGEIEDLDVKLENINETTIRTITISTANTEYNIPCYVILENTSTSPVEENTTISNQTNTTVINQTEEENNLTEEEENITEEEDTCSFFSTLFGTCNESVIQNGTNTTNKTSTNNSKVDYEVVEVGNKTVVIQNGTILNESSTSKTCTQIKGVVCSSGEICQNATIYAKDAKCCISQCVKEEKTSNKKLIGIIIVVAAFIIILFFIAKFKKTKMKKDPVLNNQFLHR